MSDERYRPRIQNAVPAKNNNQSDLQFFYDEEKLKKENRYRVKGQAFPKTISGFNWGACLLTPVWGFCNNMALVSVAWIVFAIIPVIGIILTSVLSIFAGVKGNEWVWENNEWKNVDEMHYVQKKWAIAGVIVEIIAIFIFFAYAMQHINTLQRSGIL